MEAQSEEKIRERAYQIWLEAGRMHGLELDHWTQAERDVVDSIRKPAAGASAVRPVALKKSGAKAVLQPQASKKTRSLGTTVSVKAKSVKAKPVANKDKTGAERASARHA